MQSRVGSTFLSLRDGLAVVLTTVLALGAGASVPAYGAPPSTAPPATQKQRSTPVTALTSNYSKPKAMPAFKPQPTSWPSGSADVRIDQAVPTRAGALPIWFGTASKGHTAPPGSVHVDMASRPAATAAGVDGVLLAVRPSSSGNAHVKLSYASFQHAFGGDWGTRLRLVTLPACALTSPAVPDCRRQTHLASSNDARAQTLQADLPMTLGAAATTTLLAAAADSVGGGGDFTATSLKASGSWQAGGSSDSFDWSYPIAVPPVPGNLVPKVELTYNSQSQDGLTSSTNNQASWIGDGWDYSPGFIERSYQSCHENPTGTTKTWDSCWSAKNTLTMSFNGSSTTLIKDKDDTAGIYHPQNDSNDKVEYLPGAVNGAQNGEHWRITTPDGTQYYFGKNQLPGWTGSTTPTTNSVWTEPVFSTASGQPCYNATFANSWCQQAYRWNLDYVVDTHKDTIAYFYGTDQAYYARNLGTTANTPYIRGGSLQKIQYGQRDGQVYSTTPAAKVTFTTNGRCSTSATGCTPSTLTTATAKDWPDVPYDQNCAQNATCSVQSPTFWSTAMLTGIQTQALVGTTATNVDSWALKHSYPGTNDTTTASLWLDSITRTGQDNTGGGPTAAIALPAMTFTGRALSNRVNVTNGYSPLTRHRLDTIITETGEKISVNYSTAVTSAPADAAHNTTLAYPVYWTPSGHSAPMQDWFNKYIVTHVTEQDTADATSSDDVTTTYTPVGDPAWHYNNNPLTPSDQRTWDQWRGYSGMTVSTGNAPDPVTKRIYTYFRGMDGDYLTATSTRSVPVVDSRSDPAISDLDQYAGMTYETRVFNGADVVTDTITDPWTSTATATEALTGRHAYRTDSAKTRVFTPLASGATRQTETDQTHDSYGRVTAVDDHGDTSITTDDLCTTTTFADNATKWILSSVAESKTVSVACAATPSVPADIVSDDLTYYDYSTTLGASPSIGDTTTVKVVKSYDGTTPQYATTTSTIDQYGRVTSVTDAESHTTKTAYTPGDGAAPTSIQVTDPLLYYTTTTYDSPRNLPKSTTDAAGYVAVRQYDALGRVTAGFEPGRSTSSSPSVKYVYTVSNTAPSTVSTYTLNHDASAYRRSETLYDSMLRARETQTQTAGTGRIMADTFYNTDGWQSGSTDTYYNAAAINATIEPAPAGTVDSSTAVTYDQAGRKTATIAYFLGDETWRTRYTYGGNSVTTIPPAGATASTTVTDVHGRTTTLRQYHAGITPDYLHATAGTYDDTTYTYTSTGKLATEHDAAGNGWSWTYDLLGDQTDALDPDTGHTATTYDNTGKLKTVTDAEQRQTTTKYDDDGRKIGLYDTSSTQTLSATNKLSDWSYDTVKKGLLASSTSYSGGDTYTDAVLGYNIYGAVSARKITIAGTDAAVLPAAGYTTSYGFNLNGTPSGQTDPAVAGLPTENLSYGYDSIDEPTSLISTSAYVTAVGYSSLGQPLQYTLGVGTATGFDTLTYDQQTRALTGVAVKGFGHSGDIDNTTYTFGDSAVSKGAALLTKVVDKQDAATLTDTQCFTYDYATRLQQAWTATDSCAATPTTGSSTTVGGTSPYWQSWSYDGAGNRDTQTDHDTTGVTANDTATTYHYPTAGSTTDQPHTLTTTSATGPDAAVHISGYGYDKTGKAITITGGAHSNQSLAWTANGNLASDTTTAGGTTSYAYDANGTQIIQRGPATTTLFIGDQQIVINNTTKALSASRYYSINGITIGVRTSSGVVSYVIPDRQGTSHLAINAATGAVTRRQYLPFGESRGAAPTGWPGNKGYVAGSDDSNTGLETLGARQYSPEIGRFISRDPVLEADSTAQINGYAYAGNDPVTQSDSTGLRAKDPDLDYSTGEPKPGTGKKTTPTPQHPSTGTNSDNNNDGTWTIRHNASQQQAFDYLKVAHPNWQFTMEYPVEGASKKKTGNDGRVDIIAEDTATGEWWIWEVKARRGTDAVAAGAEEQGPKDIAWYISYFKVQHPGSKIKAGPSIAQQITQPDPIEDDSTLVTVSATVNGRPSPQYDGVIVYWTRKKRDDDQKSNLPYALEASPAATESASPPATDDKPGFWQQQWQDWKHRTLGPAVGWEPVESPIDLPLIPVA